MNFIKNNLDSVDKICDYIPIVSTISNGIDLGEKMIFKLYQKNIIDFNIDTALNKHDINHNYIKHIEKKSAWRCGFAAIPIIGNLGTAAFDLAVFIKRKVSAHVEAGSIATHVHNAPQKYSRLSSSEQKFIDDSAEIWGDTSLEGDTDTDKIKEFLAAQDRDSDSDDKPSLPTRIANIFGGIWRGNHYEKY